ncbi:MAG: Zn-dependent hydrolase, partial [Nitrospinaceae bacterium]|nr:Zn-dependent hydrolase [Nitrospinaceae bacterium]
MKKYMPIRANRARMKKEFDAQSTIGRYGKTGLARIALTPEYNQVRDLVRGWMEEAGLKTRVDAVGNLFGRKQGGVKGLPVV